MNTGIDSGYTIPQKRKTLPYGDFIGASLTLVIFAVIFSPIILSPEYPIPIKAFFEEVLSFFNNSNTPESHKINLITEDGKRYQVNVQILIDHAAKKSKSSDPLKFY